tara:strand:+ start:250 stop:738 length:489 start_codon:yes stop_codon:yes gene_type:complete
MAVDMFLVLEGIPGETVDAKMAKEKAIDILAWSWGMSQSGTTHMGAGAGAGKVDVQDISFTHWVDSASPVMMQKCCKGMHIPTGKLVVRKAGDKPLNYIVIELKDIIISSISSGGSGGEDRLTENVTLNFAEFKYIYTKQNKKGGKGAAAEVAWNIAKNTGK